MALTKTFYEAVESGSVSRIRIMMKNSLLVDPSFSEYHEMERAASSISDLYEKHDGKEFLTDSSQWNDDYMDKIMVQLLSNFSHERIAHIMEVVQYLRPVLIDVASDAQEAETLSNGGDNPKLSYQEEKGRCQQNGEYFCAKIGTGAVVGAVVGGAITTIGGASAGGIAVGIAAGTAIGAVAASALTKRGK